MLFEGVWEKIRGGIPLVTYLQAQEPAETVVEDESTCHEIIEINGKTITDRLLAENQESAVEKENQAALEETGDGEAQTAKTESGEEQAGGEKAGGEQAGEKETGEGQSGEVQAGENLTGEAETEGTQTGEMETAGTQMPEEEGAQASGTEAAGQISQPLPAWTTAVETAPVKELSMERLSDFDYLLNNFFVVDPNTTIDSSQMDAASLLSDDLKLQGENTGPQILIYHTHSQEGYVDSVPGDENTSVIGVGNYLESILTDVFGYQVIHIKDAFDMMEGQLDRSKAYNYALPVVEQVLAENPSIEVVIDLHRDGVPENRHLVTEINGKPTAQVMYFNGLSRTVNNGNLDSLPNPYISDNLALSFQLSYQAAKYYPQFTRCIYLKGYRYNLHVRPKSILLEVGAQTNTVEEAMNAMEPFSVILNKVLKGE
ncbi:MAG: stage II sporulation protein P [Clostridiales bacterium]|nr:stage II sporulation protein P [Clostridiales bacterium]